MGILGAVVFIFLSDNCLLSLFALSLLALVLWGTVVRFLCNGHYNFYLQSNKKNAKGRQKGLRVTSCYLSSVQSLAYSPYKSLLTTRSKVTYHPFRGLLTSLLTRYLSSVQSVTNCSFYLLITVRLTCYLPFVQLVTYHSFNFVTYHSFNLLLTIRSTCYLLFVQRLTYPWLKLLLTEYFTSVAYL